MKLVFGLVVTLVGLFAFWYLNYFSSPISRGPVGVVVPHHDMVAQARAAYLEKVGSVISPKTIVLLSPDHFGTNQAPLVASTREWQTSVGKLIPDIHLIESLQLPKDTADFNAEHGVTTLLRDIKTYFPDSRLVPIMVSTKTSYLVVERFVNNLYAKCPDCLLIASVDFSHTLQADIANLHDVYTERELQQGDAEALFSGAEVDSGAALSVLALWARLHKAERFETFIHTNSGYITGQSVGEITTHIIGGYSVGEPVTTNSNTVTMQFSGDVIFARSIEEVHLEKPGKALTGTLGERFFWGVDAAIVNLEGVFTNDKDYQTSWNDYPPKLRFSSIFISALKEARIKAVSLANNHSYDGGEEEYQSTLRLLEKNDLIPLINRNGNDPFVYTVTEGDTKVAIMAIATHKEFSDLSSIIRKYSEGNYYVVVYAHWGNEYDLKPSVNQEAMAKRWIDAGASLVIGTHPHVVQPATVYKGVPIIYSLGNLLFDQIEPEETKVGAVLGVTITNEGQKLILVPVSTQLKPEVIEYDTQNWTKDWFSYKLQKNVENAYFFKHPN